LYAIFREVSSDKELERTGDFNFLIVGAVQDRLSTARYERVGVYLGLGLPYIDGGRFAERVRWLLKPNCLELLSLRSQALRLFVHLAGGLT